jgi:hypothetical protein
VQSLAERFALQKQAVEGLGEAQRLLVLAFPERRE